MKRSTAVLLGTGLTALVVIAGSVFGNKLFDRGTTADVTAALDTEDMTLTELDDNPILPDLEDVGMVSTEHDLSGLTDAGIVTLIRNGETFTARVRGDCADYSLESRDGITCAEFLTELVQDHALNHRFFAATTNKRSTDEAFIRAGLTANPEHRGFETSVQRRLAMGSDQALAKKLERNDTWYVIGDVSNVEAAAARLEHDG